MIDYVEIRDSSLALIGLIDTAKSVIWDTQYYGAGAFEIFTEATPAALSLLKEGNYVARVENDSIGIIEAINITFTGGDGRMIAASGRLAKAILDRRLITYVNGNTGFATVFSGNVEARARGLVHDNAISCYKDKARTVPYPQRNISILQLGELAGLPAVTEQRQANNKNLLEYTDEFLRQFGYGAKVIRAGNKLAYTVYSGIDRSIGNKAGNEPVIFSEDFDNLTGSEYTLDETGRKTFALVGGAGEGIERIYVECNAGLSDLARREVFIDAKSVQPEEGVTDAEYKLQLAEEGNLELAALIAAESFTGSIDLESSSFEYGKDFEIGDIVTVQDNGINKYINVRVVTVAEVQDDSGYQVNIEFEAVGAS